MYKKIEIPIYEQDLHICIYKTIKKAYQVLKKKKIDCEFNEDDFESKAIVSMYFSDYGAVLILTEKEVTYGTIAHEIDHIVHELLKFIGMKRTDASEEAYSYLKGYLLKKISLEIKAKGIKIND